MSRRVVVTGTGLVTPLGIGVQKTWEGLCEGRSGVDLISRFDTSDYSVKIAAEVKTWITEQGWKLVEPLEPLPLAGEQGFKPLEIKNEGAI